MHEKKKPASDEAGFWLCRAFAYAFGFCLISAWAAAFAYAFGFCLISAWAAARRAMGTRNGEQET